MTSTVSPQPKTRHPNRREFLYYLGGGSLLLLAGEVGVGLSKFLNPPPIYGEGSGIFKVDLKAIPEVNSAPKYFAEGRYLVGEYIQVAYCARCVVYLATHHIG